MSTITAEGTRAPAHIVGLRALRHAVATAYWMARGHVMRQRQRRYLAILDAEIERAVMLSLYYVRNSVDGDIAEFGVTNARYATHECKILAAFGERRNLHLFDSWSGFPAFENGDLSAPEIAARKWRNGNTTGQLAPDVIKAKLERIYDLGDIVMHQGYFADTLPTLAPQTRFAMVILDACLYSSTYTALEHLLGRGLLSEGAVLLFHCWNASRASPHESSRKAWAQAVKKFKVEYSEDGRYNCLGARFIVHSYQRANTMGMALAASR